MLTFSVNKAPLPHNHSNQISFTELKYSMFCFVIILTEHVHYMFFYHILLKRRIIHYIVFPNMLSLNLSYLSH